MSEAPVVLLNGAPATAQAWLSRALHYGDGVFRTCLIYNSQLIDAEQQLETLRRDAETLGLDCPEDSRLLSEIKQLTQACDTGVLKILLVRAGQGRGYRPASGVVDGVLIRYPAPRFAASSWTSGIRAFRCALRLADQPRLAGVKHLNRLEQVLASAQWVEDADEGILCDRVGRPIGGIRSNLFWVKDGALYTPALDHCGVAGMMRSKVMALAGKAGIECKIGAWRWRELQMADEVFVTNSLIGIWPVRELERRRLVAPGPVTARLTAALGHPRLV